MAEIKALIINSKESLQGSAGKWQNISQIHSLTSKIITPKLDDDADTSAVVSGVPTVFARENLFVYSIENAGTLRSQKDKGDDSGLCGYYVKLLDEWRGLIGFIALNSGKLEAKRITLEYSDKKEIKDTANIYEPKGAFGNMLLENKHLWTDPTDLDKNKKPFIYVIKYGGKVVGGTSPRSMLFTSVAYMVDEDSPCVDRKTHRFTDPIQNNPNSEQITALYAYVKLLLARIGNFSKAYGNIINHQPVVKELEKWLNEIDGKINDDAKAKASAWPVNLFKQEPFKVFDYSDSLYGDNGVIYSEEHDGALEFDANDLLLPKDSVVARLQVSPEISKGIKDYKEFMPVFTLRARVIGEDRKYAFFSLPLSETALKVFKTQNSLKTLLGEFPNDQIKSSLTAEFSDSEGKLKVKLEVITDTGRQKNINIEYSVGGVMTQNDIMIWPNFISKQWNKYYLYSDLPHNITTAKCPFMAVPFVGEASMDLEGITDDDNRINYLGERNLIALSDNRTSDQMYQYEIYQSDKPYKGVEMKTQGHSGGFFIIKYDSQPGNYIPTYYDNRTLKNVTLGVDFGSTNTAVAYFDEAEKVAEGIQLKDQVVSLLQSEMAQGKYATVEKNLLFFQSDTIYSNAIKSVLAIHSDQHLPKEDIKDPTARFNYIQEPVKGGMPCFRREVPIVQVQDRKLIVQIPQKNTQITLIQDMKWEDDPEEKAHKTAYLGSLLLHVYANLFEDNKVPTKLNWSYPSAMGSVLIRQYGQIWKNLGGDHSPVVGKTLDIANVPSGINNISEANPWPDEKQDTTDDGWGIPDSSDGWGTDDTTDDGWGVPDSSDGWGTDDTTDDGWGSDGRDTTKTSKKSDVKIDTGDGEAFKFTPIDSNAGLTEACAVANYLSSGKSKITTSNNALTLSFDIGGSTTDISALCQHQGKKYMVKQNSIRFAAQRLSFATSKLYEPFGAVLKTLCHRHGIKLLGLNKGADQYNKNTAPYFFEQIVDMLDDKQLQDFYNEVSANCPGLFSVNLYVTGLILFYAGQIVTKLIKEIRRSNEFPAFKDDWKPLVQIVFTGKGSRLVEWFYSVDKKSAYKYNLEMFCAGMGGSNVAQKELNNKVPPTIDVSPRSAKDVKFEVAKGLAMAGQGPDKLQLNSNTLEIIGEDGFIFRDPGTNEEKTLSFDDNITADMLRHTSVWFDAPLAIDPMKTRFFAFIKTFYKYAKNIFGFSMSQNEILDGIRNMNYNTYITNLPEFRKALKNGKNFDFVAPIIILEGMKFYEEYLLEGIR